MVYLATRRAYVHYSFLKSMITLKYLPLPYTKGSFAEEKKIQNWDRWHCWRRITVTLSRVHQNDSCRRQVSIIRSDTNGLFPPNFLMKLENEEFLMKLSKAKYYNVWGNFLLSFKHSSSIRVIQSASLGARLSGTDHSLVLHQGSCLASVRNYKVRRLMKALLCTNKCLAVSTTFQHLILQFNV